MRRLILPLLLLTALAGCTQSTGTSTSDFSGDERDVADAIADFSSAVSRKETSKACAESLSTELRDAVAQGGRSCPAELEDALDDTDLQTIEIDDVTITGTTATAKVKTEAGDKTFTATFDLVDEDGDWRINSFDDAS